MLMLLLAQLSSHPQHSFIVSRLFLKTTATVAFFSSFHHFPTLTPLPLLPHTPKLPTFRTSHHLEK